MEKAVRIACKGSDTKELGELQDFQGGLKKLTREGAKRLRKEISELGFSEPIAIWPNDGVYYILNGHQRLRVLREMQEEGYEIPPLPVSVVEAESWKEAKRKVLALTSQYGEVTPDGLADFLEDAQISLEEAMASFRFPEIDMKTLAEAEPVVEDEVPEPSAEAVTKEGELIELGPHRVLCGDATKADQVWSLMNGKRARLMVTDPPYGVNYDTQGTNPRWRKDRLPIANDDLGKDQRQFWELAFTSAAFDGDAYIFSPSGPRIFELAQAAIAAKIEHHQWLIWVKDRLVLGRSHYHYRHEHIFYGWRSRSSWQGSRTKDSVWEVERPNKSPEHPTTKPVRLCGFAISNSSQAGDLVLDPFLGSGTTLIAAEQLGRICYGTELEPRYCDVIVRRYYTLVGWDKAPQEHRKRWEAKEEK